MAALSPSLISSSSFPDSSSATSLEISSVKPCFSARALDFLIADAFLYNLIAF
jgi:hypothetical protein